MKRLSTILLVLMAGAIMFGLISCDPHGTAGGPNTFYNYKNNSSKNIIIRATSTNATTNENLSRTYTIPSFNQVLVRFPPIDYKYPFCFIVKNPMNCINKLQIFEYSLIDRDEKLLLEQSYPDGSLYNINNYTELNPDDIFSSTEFEFTFTDEFFENIE